MSGSGCGTAAAADEVAAVGPGVGRAPGAHGRWALLYDGDCEFCRRQVERIERWDRGRAIEAIPFQQADLSALGVDRSAVEAAMHLVGPRGEVARGAEAVRRILSLLPWGRPVVPLLRLPGVMRVAERAYRWVARRRHRFGCSSASCRRGVRTA